MNAPEIVVPITPNGGGIFAGRFILGEAVYGLVVASADGGELVQTQWGGLKKIASAMSYNDGLANTEAMAAAGSKLGKWVRGLLLEGYNDWYLPSRLEALIMFCELGASGAITKNWYWTSTQSAGDDASAWCQSFGDGGQYYGHKDNQLRARAVRRFLIQ